MCVCADDRTLNAFGSFVSENKKCQKQKITNRRGSNGNVVTQFFSLNFRQSF